MLAVLENFKIQHFNSNAYLSFLKGFMVLIALYQQILWLYFEGKCCCMGGCHRFPCQSLLLSTSVLNGMHNEKVSDVLIL